MQDRRWPWSRAGGGVEKWPCCCIPRQAVQPHRPATSSFRPLLTNIGVERVPSYQALCNNDNSSAGEQLRSSWLFCSSGIAAYQAMVTDCPHAQVPHTSCPQKKVREKKKVASPSGGLWPSPLVSPAASYLGWEGELVPEASSPFQTSLSML